MDRTAARDGAHAQPAGASAKSHAMIDRVVGNKPLPANVRRDIIERTDGIPLFVEEITKAVLEAESEGAARKHVCRRSVHRHWRSRRACTPR